MLRFLGFLLIYSCLYSCSKAKSIVAVDVSAAIDPVGAMHTVQKTQVQSGQGLYQALRNVSIDNAQALMLINSLSDEVEFSKLKVGDQLEATFNEKQELVAFSLSQNLVETHLVTLNPETHNWDYSLKVLETVYEARMLEGELQSGSTLEDDLLARGLERSVVNEVVNVLLCKVNFRMNARQGDHYSVLLNERKFEDKIVGTKVLYTSYSGRRAGTHEAFFYDDEVKGSTFTAHYTENGEALISSGLRYPLSQLHIRSGYGMRMHPVTGVRAMHRGVDLKASYGAEVHAVADGKVVVSGFNDFAGNNIGIKHKDGSTSYYFHLSKRNVSTGSWVRSHQVIGRVGATGRVTGAHLHFGFKDPKGHWMNPLNKRMIATPKLSGARFDNLTSQISKIKDKLADFKMTKDSQFFVAKLEINNRNLSSIDDFSFLPQ